MVLSAKSHSVGMFSTPPLSVSARQVVGNHTIRPAGTLSANVALAPALVVLWCCSVGATWTLELHELDRDGALGPIVDWISSGVPIFQPRPDALTCELLASRRLQLVRDSSAHSYTRSRHRIGHVWLTAQNEHNRRT